DLDRKFAAVLAPRVEVEPLAHQSGARIRHVTRAMAYVSAVKALRHEQLDRLTHEFISRVAEEFLDSRVDDGNPPGVVNDVDRVGRRFQKRLPFGGRHLGFIQARLQLLLSLLALGDVADDAGDEQTFTGLYWTEADLDGKLAAILAPRMEIKTDAH